MLPIYLADPAQTLTIKQITGSDKMKKHLENLGFIIGEPIMLVNRVDNNVIVKLRGVSMAITQDLAKRILV